MTGLPQRVISDQLWRLLNDVPRSDGSQEGRYTVIDLASVLVPVAESPAGYSALAWLAAALTGQAVPMHPPYLHAIGRLLRLPATFFHDDHVAAAVHERIAFARTAFARGISVIGPCRIGPAPDVSVAELDGLHVRAVELLGQHRPPLTE